MAVILEMCLVVGISGEVSVNGGTANGSDSVG